MVGKQVLLDYVDRQSLVTSEVQVGRIDLEDRQEGEEIRQNTVDSLFSVATRRDCHIHGLVLYFDVQFVGCEKEAYAYVDDDEGQWLELDTSPFSPKTHWRQCIMLFKVRASGRLVPLMNMHSITCLSFRTLCPVRRINTSGAGFASGRPPTSRERSNSLCRSGRRTRGLTRCQFTSEFIHPLSTIKVGAKPRLTRFLHKVLPHVKKRRRRDRHTN